MILVVAGPTNTIFTTLVAKIVAIGTSTLNRFFSAKKPDKPDGALAPAPNGDLSPGYVRARTTGRAL